MARFRKSVFTYPKTGDTRFYQGVSDKLITKYGLMPFTINVLHKNQTLLEKLVSLFRSSYDKDPVAGISNKIRHFYDLFFLQADKECKTFIDSDEFFDQFNDVWGHDQASFEEPVGWQGKSVSESPLFLNFPELWIVLRGTYNQELSALAFTEIPSEEKVAEAVKDIMNRLSRS